MTKTLRSLLFSGALAMGLFSSGCNPVDFFLYFPDSRVNLSPADVGLAFEELYFEAGDGTRLHGWWVDGDKGSPTIIFSHGNAGNIGDRVEILKGLHELTGANILFYDYRGYGRSAGKPSERGLVSDMEGARRFVESRLGAAAAVILYGRSLGAAVSVASAVDDPPAGLILEAPFTSVRQMGKRHYPLLATVLSPLVKDEFNNLALIGRVTVPTLFIHGEHDEIAPVEMGRSLYEMCGGKPEFLLVENAGHNDTHLVGGYGYWARIRGFVDSLR